MLPRGRKHARRRPTALPQTRRAAPSAQKNYAAPQSSAAAVQLPRESRSKRRLVRRHSAQGSARIGTRVFWGRPARHTAKEKSAPFQAAARRWKRGRPTMYSRQLRQPPTSRRMHGRTATLPYCRKPSRSYNRPARKCKTDAHVIGRTAKPPQRSSPPPAHRTTRLLGFRSLAEARHRSRAQPARQPALHAGAAHEPPPAKGTIFPFETPANTQRQGKHVIPKPPLYADEIAANALMQCTAVGRAHARRLVEHSRASFL